MSLTPFPLALGRFRGRTLSLSAFACLSALLVSAQALAARHGRHYEYESAEEEEEEEYREGRSHFDFGFDGEGAVPIGIARSPAGNDISGGGGFKVRLGDQIRFPRLWVTPEFEYGYDHFFANDISGSAYACDMHRLMGGARLGIGRVVVPTFYAHVGYGWRNTGDPTVTADRGVAFDGGFALDLHVVRRLSFGGHVEFATLNAPPFAPQWVAVGLHGDVAF